MLVYFALLYRQIYNVLAIFVNNYDKGLNNNTITIIIIIITIISIYLFKI